MNKKNLAWLVVAVMVFVCILKVGLLFTTNKEVQISKADPESKIKLPPELEALKSKITDRRLTDQERFAAIDAMTLQRDKDLAILTLEKIEETEKTTALGDRLRRAVVALRYNKPVEELKKNEMPSRSY